MKTGVLCIHGFTGGPYEVNPLAEYLANQTEWDIVIPTLPGHGVTLTLAESSAELWLQEVEIALRCLRKRVDRVIVIGFSMGGLLACYLALRYPVDRLVLLSAAAKYISPSTLIKDVLAAAQKQLGLISQNYPYQQVFSYKIEQTPLQATVDFLRIVDLVKPYYSKITSPVCIVQGKKDAIVPFTTAEYLMENLGSKQKKLLYSPTAKHHICYSEDCEWWFKEVLLFLQATDK